MINLFTNINISKAKNVKFINFSHILVLELILSFLHPENKVQGNQMWFGRDFAVCTS